MTFDRSLRAVEAADKELSRLDRAQIKSITTAIDRSIKQIDLELRRKMASSKGADLFARDRAILLANDMRDTLNVLNPNSKATQRLLKELDKTIATASEIGDNAAKDSYPESGFGAADSANISIDVVAAVARGAYDMLLNHGSQFAANASIAIQQGIMQGYGAAKTAKMIRALGDVTKSRAETIVRTETMRASIDATKRRYEQDGVEQVIWIATQDRRTCPRCASNAGRIMPADQATIPLHPNDRCYVIPYKKSWDEAGLIDHEWLNNHKADTLARSQNAS